MDAFRLPGRLGSPQALIREPPALAGDLNGRTRGKPARSGRRPGPFRDSEVRRREMTVAERFEAHLFSSAPRGAPLPSSCGSKDGFHDPGEKSRRGNAKLCADKRCARSDSGFPRSAGMRMLELTRMCLPNACRNRFRVHDLSQSVRYSEARQRWGAERFCAMRMPKGALFIAISSLLLTPLPALAELSINIDKTSQRMTVSRDGEVLHTWPVSTGRNGRDTPSGQLEAVPHGEGSLFGGMGRRADAEFDLLHQDRPRHPRQLRGEKARHGRRPPAACGWRRRTPRSCGGW